MNIVRNASPINFGLLRGASRANKRTKQFIAQAIAANPNATLCKLQSETGLSEPTIRQHLPDQFVIVGNGTGGIIQPRENS